MLSKKILILLILSSTFACSPTQKLIFSPAKSNALLTDTCDLLVVRQVKQALDSVAYSDIQDAAEAFDQITRNSKCDYYANVIYPPGDDQSVWLLTIRPIQDKGKEVILGNLYTFHYGKDSTFTYLRRVKEYSQKEEFESGKYVVFSYSVDDENTTIVKKGMGLF